MKTVWFEFEVDKKCNCECVEKLKKVQWKWNARRPLMPSYSLL